MDAVNLTPVVDRYDNRDEDSKNGSMIGSSTKPASIACMLELVYVRHTSDE